MKIKFALIFIGFIASAALTSALSNQELIGAKEIAKNTQYRTVEPTEMPLARMQNTLDLSRPLTTWARVYDEANPEYELMNSIQQTSDGGYIIAGSTWFEGLYPDFLLIKTDGNGNKQWEKTFDRGKDIDDATSVRQTSAGKYIATGRTYTDLKGFQVWLIKTDENGNKVWANTFGGMHEDYGESVQQLADAYGSYIVAGHTKSFRGGIWDIYLIKTDTDGNLQWETNIGGSRWDTATSILPTSDGGYIVLGDTESYGAGGSDLWLLKIDSNGNRLWDKTFGEEGNDYSHSIEKTSDGGYIISGDTVALNDRGREIGGTPWLIKTDSNGNKEWDRTYEGRYGTYAQQTRDGGYIIATSTSSIPSTKQDLLLIKTDASGNQQWHVTIGGPEDENAYSVRQTIDGGYIIAGNTASCGSGRSKILVVKTDAEGRVHAEPDCESISIQEY